MRISDWSSDVCSSDLPRVGEKNSWNAGQSSLPFEEAEPKGSRVSGRRNCHPKLTGVWFRACEIAKWAILLGASGKSSILEQAKMRQGSNSGGRRPRGRTNRKQHGGGGGGGGGQSRTHTFDSSGPERSEEHTSELQSLMRNSYAVFCLK